MQTPLTDCEVSESLGRPMKVHIAWTPAEHASVLRTGTGLLALLSPDGEQVIHIDLQTQRVSLRPPANADAPVLLRYLTRCGLRSDELRLLVGEVHLPGGHELGKLILRDILNVLLLSEEPPGNAPVPMDMPLPLESVSVIHQGSAWPGYERASLEPDGDILVNHVILTSMLPPPPG